MKLHDTTIMMGYIIDIIVFIISTIIIKIFIITIHTFSLSLACVYVGMCVCTYKYIVYFLLIYLP